MRLSGGMRGLPTACGWADRHHRHGAPLAQAVDKSFGLDSEIDDARAPCMHEFGVFEIMIMVVF